LAKKSILKDSILKGSVDPDERVGGYLFFCRNSPIPPLNSDSLRTMSAGYVAGIGK
jgi:hypothetical protein